MPDIAPSTTSVGISRLILGPALVTLAVTLARVVGELAHGPRMLFNSTAGGAWAIVGIIWLAPAFGVYFALNLVARHQGPTSWGRSLVFAISGVAVVFILSLLGPLLHVQRHFWGRLVYIWAVAALGALVTMPGWGSLFRTLVAYAYSARVPVAIVMFIAFWQDWGTHYDATPSDLPDGLSLLTKYLWLGFFPQLILWVGATVIAGMFFGSIAAAIARLARRNALP
jgi:hypothetical protein